VLGWGAISVARPIWKDLMECLRMQLQVEDMICEADKVAVRYTERGTSVRAFRGLGPTGKSYEIGAIEWFVMEEGLRRLKAASVHEFRDCKCNAGYS
jgi:predicted ester cyclase